MGADAEFNNLILSLQKQFSPPGYIHTIYVIAFLYHLCWKQFSVNVSDGAVCYHLILSSLSLCCFIVIAMFSKLIEVE